MYCSLYLVNDDIPCRCSASAVQIPLATDMTFRKCVYFSLRFVTKKRTRSRTSRERSELYWLYRWSTQKATESNNFLQHGGFFVWNFSHKVSCDMLSVTWPLSFEPNRQYCFICQDVRIYFQKLFNSTSSRRFRTLLLCFLMLLQSCLYFMLASAHHRKCILMRAHAKPVFVLSADLRG